MTKKIKKLRKREEVDGVTLVFSHDKGDLQEVDIDLSSLAPPSLIYAADDLTVERRGNLLGGWSPTRDSICLHSRCSRRDVPDVLGRYRPRSGQRA